jgi:hypothetical protein
MTSTITETKTVPPPADRVAAGFAFLEAHDPGFWRTGIEREIDLARLDLESPCGCVLGQRCPVEALIGHQRAVTPYEAFGARLSGLPVRRIGDLDDWAVPLGFSAVDDDDTDATDEDFYRLTAEWRRVIKSRRDEADDRGEAAS